MTKIRWGVLGAARIALTKVLPAMVQGERCEVTAIASRDLVKAQAAAAKTGITKAYGSYEELLADPDIDAIYNPLPNHLHVPWSIRAAEAGKHVLCEKPIALNLEEVRQLIAVRDRTGVKMGEAFMVHVHPQWLRAKQWIDEGRIGALRGMAGFFSYYMTDPKNIRSIAEWGGGGLMDIGCYPIHVSRWMFGSEPKRVIGAFDNDPEMKVDRLASAILDYESGQCVFQCSTQLVPYQRVQMFGTKGRIEIEIPFNAPPDRPCRMWHDGGDLFGANRIEETIDICNQYTLQGDAFARSIQEGTPVPVSLENAYSNMAVIEALFESGKTGKWQAPAGPYC